MKVLFLASGLGLGGAETALERLVPALQARGAHCVVASLRERGVVGERMAQAGHAVHALGMRPPLPSLRGLLRLRRLVREVQPDVIQGWMYHGNIAAHAAAWFAPQASVLGAIHQTLGRPELDPWTTRAVIGLDARLSRRMARVIYVAESAVRQHVARGYAADKACVLPNGFDLARFTPDASVRRQQRTALGFGDGDLVFGCVGRYHPVKNQAAFLRAAAIVASRLPQAQFVMVGDGLSPGNAGLDPLVAHPALHGRVQLLGARDDIPALMTALDALVLSSLSEGLPNVVAEAMSCSVPCVVTDVGDAAWMVGETGWIVAPGDVERLAAGMTAAATAPESERIARGEAARARVASTLSIDVVADEYLRLYRGLRQS
ncbi:glycosyltransferase [Viridibacterium curvum]|uniref:glycosyltransferase n=1 Tax=Viridibacterium curvum TaxID=1101404 RepID=UPI0031F16B4C